MSRRSRLVSKRTPFYGRGEGVVFAVATVRRFPAAWAQVFDRSRRSFSVSCLFTHRISFREKTITLSRARAKRKIVVLTPFRPRNNRGLLNPSTGKMTEWISTAYELAVSSDI